LQDLSGKASTKRPLRQQHPNYHEYSAKKAQQAGVELPTSFKKKLEASLLNNRDRDHSSNGSADQMFQRRDSSHSGLNTFFQGSMRFHKDQASFHTQNASRNMGHLTGNQLHGLAPPLQYRHERNKVQTALQTKTDLYSGNRTSSNLTKAKGRSSDLTLQSQNSNNTANKKSVRINESFSNNDQQR